MRIVRLSTTRLAIAGMVACLAVASSACGGASSADASAARASNGPKPSDPQAQALRYVKCMRAHGVNLPDPNAKGFIRVGGPNGKGPGQTPQFAKAQKACAKLMPQGTLSPEKQQQLQERFLKFAKCMRAHGVTDFPDPKFGQGGTFQIGGPGLNPNNPAVKKAQEACRSLLPTPGR
jgi:hypothetical protein